MQIRYSHFLILLFTLFLSSCATAIKTKSYDFSSNQLPQAFDSCKIAFISDLHYKSLFRERQLNKLVKKLKQLDPDILLLGGDYQEGCQYVDPLFNMLSQLQPPLGIYAVMGNNDYERCYQEIVHAMDINNIHLLEHANDTVWLDNEYIIISGVRDPFDLKRNAESPTLQLSPDDFVMLLVHTPDYAEQVDIANADLVLAGHTHGGQVRILGYAPIVPSIYGKRFMYGFTSNTRGIPVLITSGLGTSRYNVRIGARPEIVLIRLLN